MKQKNNTGLFYILIITIVFILSCDEKDIVIETMGYSAKNGNFGLQGRFQIYTDIIGDESVGVDYRLSSKYDSSIYIQAYDSTLNQTNFEFPNFQAKYSYTNSDNVVNNYRAISGVFIISRIEGGIGLGTFSFRALNILDINDTISITNGYFEITVEKYKRLL